NIGFMLYLIKKSVVRITSVSTTRQKTLDSKTKSPEREYAAGLLALRMLRVLLLRGHGFEHRSDIAGCRFQLADEGIHVVVLFGQYRGQGLDSTVKGILVACQLGLGLVQTGGALIQNPAGLCKRLHSL